METVFVGMSFKMNRKRLIAKRGLRSILKRLIIETEHICLEEIEKPKREWVKKWINRRNELGASNCLLNELAIEDPKEYNLALRMSENSFNILVNKITPSIQKKDTVMRLAIPAATKLQAVLYFLATGNSLRSLQHFYRISKASLSDMIPEICDVIYETLEEYIQAPRNKDEWKEIEKGFRGRWNLPGCCGAIDDKHIVIKAPIDTGSVYYNYKGTNSIVLMAIVDYNYCFKYIDVGCNGRISDGGVFRNCNMYTKLENGILPGGTFIIGDDAFPLKPYLLKPFAGNNLTIGQKIFNYRLSRARRIVENAFGIPVSKFRIFEKPIPFSPDKVDKIIKTCCALHNWLRMQEGGNYLPSGSVDVEDLEDGHIINGSWRQLQNNGMIDLKQSSGNHSSLAARQFREKFVEYFLDRGAVPWQFRMIH